MKEYIVRLNIGDEVPESDIETIENNYDNTSRGETVIEDIQQESDVIVDIDECGNVFDLQGNLLYGDGVCEVEQYVIDQQVMDVYIDEETIVTQDDIDYKESNSVVQELISTEDIPEIDTRCYVHWVAMVIAIFFIICSVYVFRKRRV